MQGWRVGTTQELRFQAAIRSDMGSVILQAVDLLMLRTRIFWLRNIQRLEVPYHKEVDLLMLRNSVFRWRNFMYAYCDLRGLRLSDVQESRYEAWKRLYMGCAVLLGGRFFDIQE